MSGGHFMKGCNFAQCQPEFHRTKASRVVAKSVNSVFAFGAKSSVHSLVPPFPTEPACAGLRRGPC